MRALCLVLLLTVAAPAAWAVSFQPATLRLADDTQILPCSCLGLTYSVDLDLSELPTSTAEIVRIALAFSAVWADPDGDPNEGWNVLQTWGIWFDNGAPFDWSTFQITSTSGEPYSFSIEGGRILHVRQSTFSLAYVPGGSWNATAELDVARAELPAELVVGGVDLTSGGCWVFHNPDGTDSTSCYGAGSPGGLGGSSLIVPEPSTATLLVAGLFLAAGAAARPRTKVRQG